jgi:hypothetical protein
MLGRHHNHMARPSPPAPHPPPQSILMTDPNEKMDPMSLLLYMSAISLAFLVPMTVSMEPRSLMQALTLAQASPGFLAWLAGNSCLAYFVNLTNFLVTKYTSALTLQVAEGAVKDPVALMRVPGVGLRGAPLLATLTVARVPARQVLGNAKGVVAAAVSVAVFRNAVTAQGCLGYAITVAGAPTRLSGRAAPTLCAHPVRPPSSTPPCLRPALAWSAQPCYAALTARRRVPVLGEQAAAQGRAGAAAA